jgi:hypothetical protein
MNLVLINKNGQELDLLRNRHFILASAEGLHGIEVDIGESESPYMDGVNIESVKALPRGIELTLVLRGDVEQAINAVTSVVKSKQMVTLKEDSSKGEIIVKGVVSIPPYSRMMQSCKIVLSIYCGQPYWEDLNQMGTEIAEAINLLFFPEGGQYFTEIGRPFGMVDSRIEKGFVNDGDTDVGMIITINTYGEVTNPRISCASGSQNGWWMQLNTVLADKDEVVISTVRGNKYITINGEDMYNGEPVESLLEFNGTDWLQLEQGGNVFNITAESGDTNLHYFIGYKRRFE